MKITLYTITDCQFSKQEKEYLTSHNLQFDEKNLETDKAFLTEMLAVSNNFAGTPVTKIEKDNGQSVVLKGFTKEEFDKELGFSADPSTPAPVSEEPKKEVNPVAPAPEMPVAAPAAPAPVAEAPAAMPTMPPVETSPVAPPVAAPADMTMPAMPQATVEPMPQAPAAPVAPAPMNPAPQVAQPAPAPAMQNDPSIDALLNDLQKKASYGNQQASAPQAAPAAPQTPPAPAAGMPSLPDFGDHTS